MELYLYKAKIVSVYDGDTYTALVDLGFGITMQIKLRAFGIDTPELRGEEKEDGKRVRDYVRGMILDKEVIIRTVKDKKGKYGRYLAEVFYKLGDEYINLNKSLVDKNFATIYLLGNSNFTTYK